MTTEEMKALPLGAKVYPLARPNETYVKVEDETKDAYRCSFRRMQTRGLSSKITRYHGGRIAMRDAAGEKEV